MCCCVFGTEIAKLQDLAELTIHTARDLYNERRTKGRMRRDRVWSDFCAEGPQCKLYLDAHACIPMHFMDWVPWMSKRIDESVKSME